eukprot:CAMPEP_0118725006 /NCGR_PEP_ID=MMETSP0800-20121206/32905_1 /TAXON_ID=210618 ORGANISM="Striatella unipunctata, Strain CCMP2910" /NCGR_SAMPLE_ID=MMETSP0800 /ASSEMBLY_ACC=CAM_ASM_000638 /LENGTH=49 /DNA_ID= /DNA_START= /DNA_END= /DNA_ORIENTATION=
MTRSIGCKAYRDTIVDRADGDYRDYQIGAIWVDDTLGALYQHLESIGQL